jgi:undecaprenyl-diphosphatase
VDWWEGAWLGLLQGLTEFLPVSSSGHVIVGGWVFGRDGEDSVPLSFVILVHAATLLATCVVLGPDLWRLARETIQGLRRPTAYLRTDAGRTMLGVVVATVPTGVVGLLLAPRLGAWSEHPALVGASFLVTAASLMATRAVATDATRSVPRLSLGAFLLIGLAQGLAVMPGVSRSGATIVVGMAVGLSAVEAFRFSFLLSIPAIVGATVLELRDLDELGALGTGATVGAGVAFASGLLALLVLRRLVVAGRLWIFAVYLIPLGLGLIAWEALGP